MSFGSAPRSAVARFPRSCYFVGGFGVAAITFWFLVLWFDIVNSTLGLDVVYDTRPWWLRTLMGLATWLPWLALVAVGAARVWFGRQVRAMAFAIGVGTHQAVVMGWLFVAPTVDAAFHGRPFDSVAWRTNDQTDVMWPARLAMVDDLLARHELRGMSRESVTALLGPRDDTPSFRDWDAAYWLGPERGLFRIDSEWLVLRFGSDGRVQEYQIVRD
ncbi:MAG TPA: hypothetical protein VIK60_11970 [Vicinamibacterales bacterium]